MEPYGIYFYALRMQFPIAQIREYFPLPPVAVWAAVLIGIPLIAASASQSSSPIGTILEGETAQVKPESGFAGTTIYDGGRLETNGEGTLRVLLHESQMYLRPGTVMDVHGFPNGFAAALARGSVVISSPKGQTFELLSDGMTIRPAEAEATVAQVMWVSPNELLLSNSRGAIQVSYEGETQTIHAGTSYRVLLQPDDTGPQDNGGHGNAGPVPAGHHNKIILISVLGAVAAVAGIATWRALLSPAAP